MSVSAAPNLPQSDTSNSISSSIWSNNKSAKSSFLSRFKSSNATASIIVTPSKSTSTKISASLPPIHGQQRIKRKPIASQQKSGVSSASLPGTATTAATAPPRKKYEALLGIRAEDLIAENLNSKKKSSGNSVAQTAKGFGKIFKKRSKSLDKKTNGEDLSVLLYNQEKRHLDPAVHDSSRINENEVLEEDEEEDQVDARESPVMAPIVNQSMSDKPVILANNHVYKPQYHQYEVGQQPSAYSRSKAVNTPSPPQNEAARWSIASTNKSTGSHSIYSTFGPESVYADSTENVNNTSNLKTQTDEEDSAKLEVVDKNPTNETDLVSIVANNVQTRNSARLLTESEIAEDSDDDDSCYEIEDDEEDEDDDVGSIKKEDEYSLSNQSDVFVDATDASLEELDREKIEARLSKRLSGGHFGSAGGLMISILASSSTDTKTQKRKSRPPPEDVVQSMINWKRQSGQGSVKHITPDQQQSKDQDANEQQSDSFADTVPPLPTSFTPAPPVVPDKDTQFKQPDLEKSLPLTPDLTLENEADIEKDDMSTKVTDSVIEIPDSPKQCAARLWEEDETFVFRERIAEWLGQSKELNAKTLTEYMNYFEFATMRLDSAFRKVCSKLYFRAEAQQIDRILEAFAKRYWQCNPKAIFGSADIVYAVVYSLLLLNTDLHVAQGNYTRMTRQAFVKNTMSTIRDQQKTDPMWAAKKPNFMLAWEAHIEAYLKDMYTSVKNYQILQPMQYNMEDSGLSTGDEISLLSVSAPTNSKRMSMMGGKRMNDIKRSLNTMIHKTSSARESMLFLDEPSPRKSSSSNTRQHYPSFPRRSKSVRSNRRDSFSSSHSNSSSLTPRTTVSSNSSQLSPNPSHVMSFMDAHTADLFANRPPYLKEGIVMRKHLLESANQKAKHREWRECLLVVGQGELKMYGLQSDSSNDSSSISSGRRNVLRASSASFANLTGSLSKNYQNVTNSSSANNLNVAVSYDGGAQSSSQRWANYSHLVGSIELNHTLSNALPPPGYNKLRPHVFAIQEANGGVYLIQTTSNEQLFEWVSTCNYWAARQSKEPLQGGIGNLEYGWGRCLDDIVLDSDAAENGEKTPASECVRDLDDITVSHWIPPAPTIVSSTLDESAQLESLQTYVNQLNEEINEHREIKRKIMVKFRHKGQNQTRALANWEAKSKYMLHEIIKYQNYCDSLEKSIQNKEAALQDRDEDVIAEEPDSLIVAN
ncbi:hypothetical protein [Parasitella parasitica]|uniref:SEC7 domain-containing protein n=1 Tax=Parasitella parasitica TaxID=35722 RepID=A0A0B7N4V6_9FUNG|nr:hypothetical protein [Parasitella parasitica]